MTATLLSYHGDLNLKVSTIDQMVAHQRADEIMQGLYWGKVDGVFKGCAVGCMTHTVGGGHSQYPTRWGIPEQLAWLEDTLFEMLSPADAKEWPVRFLTAIPVGADLSRVWDRWALWNLRDLASVNQTCGQVVEAMVFLFERAVEGDEPTKAEWSDAAYAADAAYASYAAYAADAARAARAARTADAARAADAAYAACAAYDAYAAYTAYAADAAWPQRACDALVDILENTLVSA